MQANASAMLVFAATGDNRLILVDRLTQATQGECPIKKKKKKKKKKYINGKK